VRASGLSSERFKSIRDSADVVGALNNFFIAQPPIHSGGLYHYTRLDAAKKILKDRFLLLSSSRILNDTREPQEDGLYVVSLSFGAIESVAMWGIYSRPLSEAVRIRFHHSEIKELARQYHGNICPVAVRKNLGKPEYRILGDSSSAVILNEEPQLSDILYVDYVKEKSRRDTASVAVRWNSNSIRIDRCALESVRRGLLRRLMKYSGWAYERETRLCVKADIDNDKVSDAIRRLSGAGWELSSDRIALRLAPQIVQHVDVRGGPCLSAEEISTDFLAEGIEVGRTEESVLRGSVRGGVFCEGCVKVDGCRISHH